MQSTGGKSTQDWSHIVPIEHRYNVRHRKNMYLRDVTSDSVKQFAEANPGLKATVEIYAVEKPCCREHDKYLGSFPLAKVLVDIESQV